MSEKTKQVLEMLEWSVQNFAASWCPICNGMFKYGHKKYCLLAEAMTENGLKPKIEKE